MRYTLLGLLLGAACVTPAETRIATPIELLIAGQSNGVSPSNGEPTIHSTTGHVWVSLRGSPLVQPPDPNNVNQAWIILGDSLHRLTGRDVYVYNSAYGGRNTAQLFAGVSFAALADAVMLHPAICAVLWIQGESEQGIHTDSTYRTMRAMIDSSRVLRPNLAWLVAPNAHARVAQLRLLAEGVVRRGPDIDSLRTNPAYFQPDGAEFSGLGLRAHAEAWVAPLRGVCH